MDGLNLIACVNHMKKIVFRLNDFVEEECSDFSSETATIEDVKGLKEGLAQLIWVEEIYIKLFEKFRDVKSKYNKKLEPIVSNLQYTVTHELKTMNKDYDASSSLKLPEFNIFNSDIDLFSFNTWAEDQECYTDVGEIASINELGWPGGVDNILPLKKILFNAYRDCVGTPKIEFEPVIESEDETYEKVLDTQGEAPIIIGEYSYNCSGFKMLLPIIKSLDDIPQNMYYYRGDKKNKRGVYSRISDRIVIKIPMVETIRENADNSRQMIVKCNKGKDCTFWNCTYAHPGVPYNKIGYVRRAFSCPGFSNIDTLKTDIKIITYEDIRICLMYATTDMFAVRGWCQDQEQQNINPNDSSSGKLVVWDNLDICGTYTDPLFTSHNEEETWDKLE